MTAARRAALVMTVGLAIVVGSCACPAREIGVVRFTCPGDPVVVDVVDSRTGAIVRTERGLAISEPITEIPEFHDCQRFVVRDHYDSLYAIFASFRLDSIALTFAHDSGTAVPGTQHGIVPVATIYSHGGTYEALGIKPGFNCLFLFRKFNDPRWNAKMVPWGGSTDPNCADRRYDPLSTGTLLTVNALTGSSLGSKDYPPVARWDWDATNQEHYIGIACGPAWCEVGKAGFQSSVAYNLPEPTWHRLAGRLPDLAAAASHRVYKVKGWYDAQPLATWPNGAPHTGLPRPGPARGFLIPHPLLDSVNNAASVSTYQTWGHVATAVIEGEYPKWNLTNGQNEIWFCYGTTATCQVSDALTRVEGASTPLTHCPDDPVIPTQHWWAKVVSAAGVTKYACVERRDHSQELEDYRQHHTGQAEIRIPGAARWHWLPDDESQWISCENGCCTIKS